MRERILVIGQHPMLRLTLCSWVEALLPTIYTIDTGNERVGLELAQNLSPALIILDAGFPGMDSLEFITCLKSATPNISLIVLTTYRLNSYCDQALEAGAAACLAKDTIYQDHFLPLLTEFLSDSYQIKQNELSNA